MSTALTATPDVAPPLAGTGRTQAMVAERLLRWVAIGGLVLGTFGTFHAVSSLFLGVSPGDRAFRSPTLESVHRLAVMTIIASQVLQMIGGAALFRRRLLGRTLLLTYASLYLAALVLLQVMHAVDHAGMYGPAPASQRAIIAMSQLHLLVYGSIFPMFLVAVLSRPWVTRLLRRKGEPLPPAGSVDAAPEAGTPGAPATAAPTGPAGETRAAA